MSHQVQSPNGRFAITFSKPGASSWIKEGILWDVTAGRQQTFQVPVDTQSSSAFSTDSSLLATCSGQKTKTIRIWDLAKGSQVASFEDEKAGSLGVVFFGGDEKTIYVAGHHMVGYDVATGKNFCSWRLTPLPGNGVREFFGGRPPTRSNSNEVLESVGILSGRFADCLHHGKRRHRSKTRSTQNLSL